MSLKNKAISGVLWTFSQQISVQSINLGVQIVLARILMPDAFGLLAMMQIFIAIGTNLLDGGMTSSLIRTINTSQKDYSTVFYANLFISIFLYVIIFFLAPLIADFYNQNVLKDILRVFAISFVIAALLAVQTTRLTKEMNFKLQMQMQIPSVIVGGTVGVLLAAKGYGVWSLVWMNLVQNFLFMAMHWIFGDWRPSWVFDKIKFKEHFRFGYKITISGLLHTLYVNFYNIIIGKYYLAALAGFYYQADSLRSFPVRQITTALDRVTYPMFSSIQNDEENLKKVYKKTMQAMLFLVVPVMTFLIIFGKEVFLIVLGQKWLPAVAFFQILCISSALEPLQTYNLNILKVKGRSDLFLRLHIITRVIPMGLIFIIIPLGIYSLVWFQSLFAFILFYTSSYYSGRLINYKIKEQINDIWKIFAAAIISGLATFFIQEFIIKDLIQSLVIQVLTGAIIFGVSYVFIAYFKLPIFEFYKERLYKIKRTNR